MKIFEFEEDFFSDWVEESDRLAREKDEIPSPGENGNPELWEAFQKWEAAKISLASPSVIDRAGRGYMKIRNEEMALRTQNSIKKNELNRALETGNRPVIDYLIGVTDEGLNRLRRSIIFDRRRREKNYIEGTQKIKVETNLGKINGAREALLAFKSRVRDLLHSPCAEILNEARHLKKELAEIDFRKTEEIEIPPFFATEIENSLKGEASLPPSPELYRQAERGRIEESLDSVLGKFDRIKKDFLKMLPV